MQVAQSLGGEFTEEEAVIPGEAAELPNTELSGNRGDRRHRRISGFERPPDLVKGSQVQILHRRYAEVVLKRITKCSLRNTGRTGELVHGKVLAVMLVDEIHRRANDLSSRNRMPAKRGFDFVRQGEHVASLSDQLLLCCLLRRARFEGGGRPLDGLTKLLNDRSKSVNSVGW